MYQQHHPHIVVILKVGVHLQHRIDLLYLLDANRSTAVTGNVHLSLICSKKHIPQQHTSLRRTTPERKRRFSSQALMSRWSSLARLLCAKVMNAAILPRLRADNH